MPTDATPLSFTNMSCSVFVCASRYMTALTDSEEDELRDAEEGDREQPADKLSVLLKRIDSLHQGTEGDKKESLNLLLEHRREVCYIG